MPNKINYKKTISSILLILQLFVFFIFPLFQVKAAEELYFIHQDHLGSTTVITDESGKVVQQERNFPYGESRLSNTALDSTQQSPITERGYTSQIKDAAVSLYYYNARYYDSQLGTFISADPAGERFAYAGGNPVMFTDPTGYYSEPYEKSFREKMSATWRAIFPRRPRAGSLSGAWHDANLPWHLRRTREGRIMGDALDLGKGFAFAGALYGANWGVANLRSSFANWSVMDGYDPFSVAAAGNLSGQIKAQAATQDPTILLTAKSERETVLEAVESIRSFKPDFAIREGTDEAAQFAERVSKGNLELSIYQDPSGKVVGYATIYPIESDSKNVYLNKIFVNPDFRGTGIATSMISDLQRSYEEIHLMNVISDKALWQAMAGVYQRLGFEQAVDSPFRFIWSAE